MQKKKIPIHTSMSFISDAEESTRKSKSPKGKKYFFGGEKYLNEPILWHEKFSIPDKKCFENVTVDI